MGIIILAVLAMGVFTIVRWMVSFFAPRFKRSSKITEKVIPQAIVVLDEQNEIDFSAFETPTYIRRGITPKVCEYIEDAVMSCGEMLGGWDFSSFETPSFLRRGMQYPVLAEKKRGRTRKTKPVFAAA